MVRLQRICILCYLSRYISFNPTMVRLQRTYNKDNSEAIDTFNPTMVRLQPSPSAVAPSSPMLLSIPLWCDCNCDTVEGVIELLNTFNPTMVRLQLLLRVYYPLSVGFPFNPTMVRLQHQTRKAGSDANLLSIPLWCDCNPSVPEEPHGP